MAPPTPKKPHRELPNPPRHAAGRSIISVSPAPRPGPTGGAGGTESRPAAAPLTEAEEVFRQYGFRIFNVARRMLANEADVEDVTQEVLLQVVRKLDTFRGEADLATWLHRVTVNAALVYRRKHAPRLAREVPASAEHIEAQGRPVSFPSPWADGPDRQAIDRETRELIEQAVRGLPEKYRDPFVLSDVEGLSNAEIGELLGLSLPAVKSRLHRARLLLRDALRPHFEESQPVVVLACPVTT